MYPYLLIFLVFIVYPITMNADTEFQIVQLTTIDGLVNNTIRDITQDSQGRLWICTSNGLSCYDGDHFTNYRPSHDEHTYSLSDQRTRTAKEVNGKLWISTAKDISCLDLKTLTFIDYKKLSLNTPSLPTGHNTKITDSKGRIWKITEDDGLYIINNKTGESEHFTTTSKNNPLPTNALKCIFIDRDGTIWIGTDNLGISQIKVVQNDGVKYMLEGENIRMLSLLGKDKVAIGNRSGDVWIYDATLSHPLQAYHREKNTYCILKDNDNNIWEGTKGAGLYLNGENHKENIYDDIYSLLQDRQGNIWIGSFGGGLQVNGNILLNDDYSSKRIRKLIEDKEGNIWTATSNGIFIITPSSIKNKTKAFTHLCIESGHLYSNEVRTMYMDSHNNFYIAETGEGFGVVRYNRYQSTDVKHYTQNDSLINSMIQSFVEDEDGFVWIATEFGISKFNPSTQTFKNYFFSKNMLNNVYSENCGVRLNDGRLAFGTNNGIIIINPKIYNQGEKNTDITAEDITINGNPAKKGIIYVVSKWWKSPWALLAYGLLIIGAIILWRRIKNNNSRFHKTIKELNIKKDRLTIEKESIKAEKDVIQAEKDEILAEKEIIQAEKDEMEEQYTTEVRIKREAEKSAADKDFISKIESIAEKELSNSSFSADDFASQMGLGRTVFFNRMKTITGYSPKEYMKLTRIKRAAELISTSAMPIGEIAFSVGIEDPLYFSRIFKQQFGMTPTEWRNRNMKGTVT